MNVVALLGSPRADGASASLTRRFLAKAEEHGITPVVHELNKLTYRGCQGCFACKSSREDCILKDDLSQVLADVARADLLVLATPVYFGEVTSQLKGFIDRTFSYLRPDFKTSATPSRLAPGKMLVLVQTQGNPEESAFLDIFARYSTFLKRNSFEEANLIRARGVSTAAEAEQNEAALKQLAEVADAVFGAGGAKVNDQTLNW